jgi:hypothetical protein
MAIAVCVGAVAADGPPFEQLKTTYEQQSLALDQVYDAAISNAPLQYVQSLTVLEKKYVGAGNLDGVIAVRNERLRFEVDKALVEKDLVANPPDLAAAQTWLLDAPKRADMERMRGIGTLTRQYSDALERLKVQLTKSGQIQDALSVKAEIDRLVSSVPKPPTPPTLRTQHSPVTPPSPPSDVRPPESKPATVVAEPLMEDITAKLIGGTRGPEGIVLKEDRLTSRDAYTPPVEIEYVCKTDSTNIRLTYAGQLIFNWELNPSELKYGAGPVGRQNRPGAGLIPINKFVTIRKVVTHDNMSVFVDGAHRASWTGDFSKVNSPVGIHSALGSTVTVKSIRVRKPKDPAKPLPLN